VASFARAGGWTASNGLPGWPAWLCGPRWEDGAPRFELLITPDVVVGAGTAAILGAALASGAAACYLWDGHALQPIVALGGPPNGDDPWHAAASCLLTSGNPLG
jgi:hypothetical protein